MIYPNINQHSPALRQAVISVLPYFYQYNAEKRYFLFDQLADEQREKVYLALSYRLFNQAAKFENLDVDKKNIINQNLCPLSGLGEDCFFFDEIFTDERPMHSLATLQDYDYYNYNYTIPTNKEDSSGYQHKTEYYGSLSSEWATCINRQGQLTYLNLSTVASDLAKTSHETVYEIVDHYIPTQRLVVLKYGNSTKDSTILDYKIDANGLEGQRDWLINRCLSRISSRQFANAKKLSTYEPQVMFPDRSADNDEGVSDILFMNEHTLAEIRLDHFL
jgi:hypothetical protein